MASTGQLPGCFCLLVWSGLGCHRIKAEDLIGYDGGL